MVERYRTQPNFMPEFQGGSYNPWGGPEGGCPGDIGADFANLFYRNLIYQRVTAISLYMLFGGTNWGWLAAPVVGKLRRREMIRAGADFSSLKLRLFLASLGESSHWKQVLRNKTADSVHTLYVLLRCAADLCAG